MGNVKKKSKKDRASQAKCIMKTNSLYRLKIKVLRQRWAFLDKDKNDLVVPLGNNSFSLKYNVSYFLRQCVSCASTKKWIAQANEAIPLIDAKVDVDPSNPKYAHIYQGIDTIVHRLIAKLAESDDYFKHTKLRQTGSIFSNTKVGLPHEADYALELPHAKTLKNKRILNGEIFFEMVKTVLNTQVLDLTEGFEYLVIHGVKRHKNIGAVCLAMQCMQNTESVVGVTVDIVPVNIVKPEGWKWNIKEFNETAKSYLSQSLAEYVEHGDIYTLLNSHGLDSGIIENRIIQQLPEDRKRPFRIVKFFLQNIICRDGAFPSIEIDNVDRETSLKLYGYRPHVSSYIIRLFFLRLLIHVHNTKAEPLLKDGLLLACVLDMLSQFETHNSGNSEMVGHPLFNEHSIYFFKATGGVFDKMYRHHMLIYIICQFQTDYVADLVEGLRLLNYPPYETVLDSFQERQLRRRILDIRLAESL